MATKAKPKLGYQDDDGWIAPFKFTTGTRKVLDSCLEGQTIKKWPEGFLDELQQLVGEFQMFEAAEAEKPRPAQIVAALDLLQNRVDSLATLLGSGPNGLDSETLETIWNASAEAGLADSFDDLAGRVRADLTRIEVHVAVTRRALDETGGPRPGPLRKDAEFDLKKRVKELFEKHHLPVVKAEGSLFNTVLAVLLGTPGRLRNI